MEQEEADDRRKIFAIALLADRLRAAAEWLARHPETQSLRLGYFGASTSAAAALVAAARPPEAVGAIVSRGGRPDLAWDDLPAVEASTLLIVGGRDEWGLELNRQALERLHCPKELMVTPGATDAAISGAAMVVPEPGALEEVARRAARWFRRHLEEVSGREQQRGDRFPRANRDLEC